jgi:hypothetical protein
MNDVEGINIIRERRIKKQKDRNIYTNQELVSIRVDAYRLLLHDIQN